MDADLLNLLCCPDCRAALAFRDPTIIVCAGCGRQMPVEDGIPILLPSETLPDERFADPEYQRWLAVASETLEDYFENGNGLFHAIHHSAHRTLAKWVPEPKAPILDLGCGAGAHFPYYKSLKGVLGIDLNLAALKAARRRFPEARVVQADIYKLPLRTASFGSVISVYNLEHIYHLESALDEVARILNCDGILAVGLPCEGGWAWNSGRKLTSERTLGRRYAIDYRKIIAIEHCNTAAHVLEGLERRFHRRQSRFFPLSMLPCIDLNLTVAAVFGR